MCSNTHAVRRTGGNGNEYVTFPARSTTTISPGSTSRIIVAPTMSSEQLSEDLYRQLSQHVFNAKMRAQVLRLDVAVPAVSGRAVPSAPLDILSQPLPGLDVQSDVMAVPMELDATITVEGGAE